MNYKGISLTNRTNITNIPMSKTTLAKLIELRDASPYDHGTTLVTYQIPISRTHGL